MLQKLRYQVLLDKLSGNVIYAPSPTIDEKETLSTCAAILLGALSVTDRMVNERRIPSANCSLLGHPRANPTITQARQCRFISARIAPRIFGYKCIYAVGIFQLSRLRQCATESARSDTIAQSLRALSIILNATGNKSHAKRENDNRTKSHGSLTLLGDKVFQVGAIRTSTKAQAESKGGSQDRGAATGGRVLPGQFPRG